MNKREGCRSSLFSEPNQSCVIMKGKPMSTMSKNALFALATVLFARYKHVRSRWALNCKLDVETTS